MSPSDKSLIIDWETDLEDAKEYVRKLNIISTNKEKEPEVEVEKAEDVEVKSGINWQIKCAPLNLAHSITIAGKIQFKSKMEPLRGLVICWRLDDRSEID